jgi:opacity protein-like surface antigen
MFIVSRAPVRPVVILLTALACWALAAPASAQGLGVGGRLAWVKPDADATTDSLRFTGLHLRLLGQRAGAELSMDRRTETFDALEQTVTDTPIQASLLLRLGPRSFAPYLLGGPGWYRRSVRPIDGASDEAVRTTEFGWHAGAGLEARAGRRFGIHADYRYTFLDFGEDDDEEDDGLIGRLLPGHRGSMWTLGATIYF